MIRLWGLLVTYVGVSIAVLVAIRRRTPSDASDEQRRANGRIVLGLVFLGALLSIGVGIYFAA